MNQDMELSADHPTRLSPMNTREQALLATYDFLKHMSGLSLVAMGGMLGLVQGVGIAPTPSLLRGVAIIGLAGFMALAFMAGITATQIRQRVHKSSNAYALAIVIIVLALFSAGLGSFVGAFFRVMQHR